MSLGDRVAFVQGFLRHPKRVGSIVPSSASLLERLLAVSKARNANTIVELGPGTGGTTAALLNAMPGKARLLAIEVDPVFHARLAETHSDPRLLLQLGDASRLSQFLASCHLPLADLIVSGIPFSTMPPENARCVARTVGDCLAPGGRFVAYQVRSDVARYLVPVLGAADIAWEWLNIPPLRVFCWTKGSPQPTSALKRAQPAYG